jgi:hypothetical protein
VTAEDRLRDALRAGAARVVVDEDAAWAVLRARLEQDGNAVGARGAAGPARRPRSPARARVAVACAAAVVVAVGTTGFWLATRGEGPPSKVATAPVTSATTGATTPQTAFDTLAPRADVPVADWVDAVRTLVAARPNVGGRVEATDTGAAASASSVTVTFAADRDGQFTADDSSVSTIGLADGTTVEVVSQPRIVRVRSNALSVAFAPEGVIGRVVRPDLWVESVADTAAITFDGRDTVDGRAVLRFTVRFPDPDAWWTLDLDVKTGVLLDAVVRSSDREKAADQEIRVLDFTDSARELANETVALPEGFTIEATIDTAAGPRALRGVVGAGATVGSVVADLRAEATK